MPKKKSFPAFCLLLCLTLLLAGISGCQRGKPESAPAENGADKPHTFEAVSLMLEERDWKAAEAAVREGISGLDDPVFKRNLLAAILAEQDRLEEAHALFVENFQAQPEVGLHAYNMGAVLRRMGKPEPALHYLQKASTLGGVDPILVAYNKRLALVELGRSAEIEEAVRLHLEKEPPDGDWLMTAAAIALQRGFISEAAELLQAARLRLQPQLYSELLTDRYFQAFTGHPEIAAVMVHEEPDLPNLNLAADAFSQNDLAAAEAHATAALEAGEPAFPAYSIRALARFGMHKSDVGIEDFAAAVADRPDNAGGWLNYGEALRSVGRNEDALEAFKKACALQPLNPLFAFKQGLVHLQLGQDIPSPLRIDQTVSLTLDLAAAARRGDRFGADKILAELNAVSQPEWLDMALQDPYFQELAEFMDLSSPQQP